MLNFLTTATEKWQIVLRTLSFEKVQKYCSSHSFLNFRPSSAIFRFRGFDKFADVEDGTTDGGSVDSVQADVEDGPAKETKRNTLLWLIIKVQDSCVALRAPSWGIVTF